MNNEKKIERIGYGYNRGDKDFAPHNCDRVFIDTTHTKRAGLYDMLHNVGLREGETIVVFFERELGRGMALKQVREFIASKGCTIEAVGVSNGHRKATVRGMSDDAKAIAKPYWHLPGCSIDFINDQLQRAGHGPFTRSQFIRGLGKRGTYKTKDE